MGSRHWRLTLALCLALANAACSKDEPTKEQRLSRADAAFAAGQSDKAEKEYRDVLRLAPDDPTALRQLGIIYLDQGQIRTGLSAAQEIRRTAAGRSGNTTQAWSDPSCDP